MEFGSELNKCGQRLWWGLHLADPEKLELKDSQVIRFAKFDNEIKFIEEARSEMYIYFSIREITPDGMKYVPYRRLHKKDIDPFRQWEHRHPIRKIDSEPGEKCIWRNDYLSFKKEQLIARYHELMIQEPEEDLEEYDRTTEARGKLRDKIQKFIDEQFVFYRIVKIGIMPFDVFSFKTLKGFVEFQQDVRPGDIRNIEARFKKELNIDLSLAVHSPIKEKTNMEGKGTDPDFIFVPKEFKEAW
ncbi:MAG: hypothetical protein ACQER7_12160 [Bacteroidota bacterium]